MASMTKVMGATVAAIAFAEGVVKPNDPISKWSAQWPTDYRAARIVCAQRLLQHTVATLPVSFAAASLPLPGHLSSCLPTALPQFQSCSTSSWTARRRSDARVARLVQASFIV